jgi:ribosomal protein S13
MISKRLHHYYDKKHLTSKNKDEDLIYSISVMKKLSYCLDILKIKENTEFHRNAVEFMRKVIVETVKNDNGNSEWITVMEVIASVCSNDGHAFSQSGLSDFLTLATKKGISENRMRSVGAEIVNDVIFKIYKDIVEGYHTFNQTLKSNYPGIIVNIISIINHGMEAEGKSIGVYRLYGYYQSQKIIKAQAVQKHPGIPQDNSDEHQELDQQKDLIQSLSQITGMGMKELGDSLAKLQGSDVKKINDLCINYNKLQKYSKLIGESGGEFSHEVERELGRKLSDTQLQHAINSIRKVRTYIGNILDGKFVAHGSHGINHVKHNLEYGFQLMGLIECKKRSLLRH